MNLNTLQIKLTALNSTKQTLARNWNQAKIKEYTQLLTRRKRSKLENLEARIEQEIRQIEAEISSAAITDSNVEPLFSEIVEARKNLDLPEWQEVLEFSEELLAYGQRLEANTVAEIEEMTSPDWLLPTSTLSKHVLDLWEKFLFEQHPLESIDTFWLKLVNRERIQETLLNWEQEPLIEDRCPVLKQGVNAHLDQLFYLSISALVPQIEGLLRDILKNKGKSDDFNSLSYDDMKNATLSLTDTWKHEAPTMLQGVVALLKKLPNTVADLYLEYDPQKAVEEKLYRHGICHGLQLDFASEKNSLRLILIIDRIVYFYTNFNSTP